jgi:hypothetical protein
MSRFFLRNFPQIVWRVTEIILAAKLESKESELSKTLNEKSTCLAEKNSSNKALNEKLSELSICSNSLSDCQRENLIIYRKRDRLTEQLQTFESKKSPKSINFNNTDCDKLKTDTRSKFWIVVGTGTLVLVLLILLIALLISIMKNHQLLDDNKFLKTKLDKLCEDHIYEKVD